MDLTQKEEPYPFGNEGPVPFFPPVCIRSHWDPTARLRHILPQGAGAGQEQLPMDFRPYTKVCMTYTTSGAFEPVAAPPSDKVYPPGGEFYPPSRYASAIDSESLLRRLDRPLGTCEADQYVPRIRQPTVIPDRKQPDSRFIQELAFPQVLLRDGPYPCRAEADVANWSRSEKPFFNATKQERYKASTNGQKVYSEK